MSEGDVTALLLAWRAGDVQAHEQLIREVHEDLRRLARSHLAREGSGHLLQPTALVHQAYLRLIDQQQVRRQNRAHFFAVAATAMRQVLVRHARARVSAKRGGGGQPTVLLDVGKARSAPPSIDVLVIDETLERLCDRSARQARVIELRFFGGLSIRETAEVLECSVETVKLDWRIARAWIYRQVTSAVESVPSG